MGRNLTMIQNSEAIQENIKLVYDTVKIFCMSKTKELKKGNMYLQFIPKIHL